jgi:hypothetical protein
VPGVRAPHLTVKESIARSWDSCGGIEGAGRDRLFGLSTPDLEGQREAAERLHRALPDLAMVTKLQQGRSY